MSFSFVGFGKKWMSELEEANKVEKRKWREEREKRKKENVMRTGTKLHKITNPKTLAKSKPKLLKVILDELVKN